MSSATDKTVTVTFDPTAINKQSDVISGATSTRAGAMTAQQVQQLDAADAQVQQALAEEDVIIYANSVTGNDANDGLTPATAVQTLAAGLALWPLAYKKRCVLNLSGTGFVAPALQVFLPIPVGPAASPPVILGEFTDELGTVTATANDAGGLTVTDGTLAMAPDAYRGAFITVVTAANAANLARTRLITGNTGTALSLNGKLPAGIVAGDTFVVKRPATVITLTSNNFRLQGQGGVLGLKGLKFTSGFRNLRISGFEFVMIPGCEFENSFAIVDSALVSASEQSARWSNDGVNNPFIASVGAFGSYLNGSSFILTGGGVLTGVLVMDFASVETFFDGKWGLSTPNGRFSQILAGGGSVGNFITLVAATPPGSMDGDLYGDPNLGIVDVQENSDITTNFGGDPAGINEIDLSNGTGPGLRVAGRSYVSADGVTGTGNGTYGIACVGMSQVVTNGTCTVTGTSGDVLVGATPKVYGALPFSEVDGSGPTLNRVE